MQTAEKEQDLWMYQNVKEEAKILQGVRKPRKDEEMAWPDWEEARMMEGGECVGCGGRHSRGLGWRKPPRAGGSKALEKRKRDAQQGEEIRRPKREKKRVHNLRKKTGLSYRAR